MRHKNKIYRNAFLGIILISFLTSINVQAQSDDIFAEFLLNESDMPGYKLVQQYKIDWKIGENQYKKAIRQTWEQKETNESTEYIILGICVFTNEIEAIRGTTFYTGTHAAIFNWGSWNGSAWGDNSWSVWENHMSGSLIFVRGNVGAHVGVLNSNGLENRLSTMAGKVLDKIEINLWPEILAFEDSIKQKQIQENKYEMITEPVVNSNLMAGFAAYSTWDSKWPVDSTNMAMGIRKEWKNGENVVIGLDICKFESSAAANQAGELKSNRGYLANKLDLQNLDSLGNIMANWQGYGMDNNMRVVGVMDNIAIHIYHYDSTGVDTSLFRSLVEALTEQIRNF